MNRALSAVLLTVVVVGSALAFDPPRIIGVLHGRANSQHFGDDYCNVGDWNGDGCDELLFSDEPYVPGDGDGVLNLNQVELYYGGHDGLNDSATVLLADHDTVWTVGSRLIYVGQTTRGDTPYFGVLNASWGPQGHRIYPTAMALLLFRVGNQFDGQPVFEVRDSYRPGIDLSYGYMGRPTDLNGDGIKDIIATYGPRDPDPQFTVIEAFFGGDTLDTIPDWRVGVPSSNDAFTAVNLSSGRDVNGDGYDDILLSLMGTNGTNDIYLFLGGDPMPTQPLFHFAWDHFAGKALPGSCALLGDVNRDGYDDWAIFWETHDGTNGYYLFYGGAHPDSVPDLTLQGYNFLGSSDAPIASGDFNGDGVGDVVTSSSGGNHDYGAIHIYFGSRGMTGSPDINLNCVDTYGRQFLGLGAALGAVGDYNGDGVDDFVVRRYPTDHRDVVILAGNRDWHVNVPKEPEPVPLSLSLSVSPNPFNEEVSLQIRVTLKTDLSIKVYDIKGAVAGSISSGLVDPGLHRYSWKPENLAAGVYILALKAPNSMAVVRKMVYLR